MTRAQKRPRGPRDGCAVDSASLTALVVDFVARWQAERPATVGRFGVESVDALTLTAYDFLSSRSGLPKDAIEKIHRGKRRSPAVELDVADRLVAAMGRPDVFYDGTLPVIPNPAAARRAREACCGGSVS